MKFTPGPAIASASGSIGGTTFSHNRFGAYTRKRAIPTDPNTNRQQAVKANFAALSTAWNTVLTPEQREAWNQYGANVPRVDALGQTHYLPGIQWFIGLNTIWMQGGQTMLTGAPTTYNRGELPAFTNIVPSGGSAPVSGGTYLGVDGTALTVHLEVPVQPPLATAYVVYLGRPQNPTINFYKAPWRYVGSLAIPVGTTESLAVPAGLYTVAVGQVIWMRVRRIEDDGRYSPAVDFRLTAIDTSD